MNETLPGEQGLGSGSAAGGAGDGDELAELDEAWDDEAAIVVPVSAVEHYSYCPRQCALIHVEQVFEENEFTVRGRLAHERVDSATDAPVRGISVLRSLPLRSHRLGLRGKADLVELRPEGPYPVEYKSGRRHGIHADLQLCAQALCLEEMLGMPVERGALFYYATRSRHEVRFSARIRELTEAAIAGVRAMLQAQEVPAPANDGRCRNCSLIDACLPEVVAEPSRLRGLQSALFHPWSGDTDDADEEGDEPCGNC